MAVVGGVGSRLETPLLCRFAFCFSVIENTIYQIYSCFLVSSIGLANGGNQKCSHSVRTDGQTATVVVVVVVVGVLFGQLKMAPPMIPVIYRCRSWPKIKKISPFRSSPSSYSSSLSSSSHFSSNSLTPPSHTLQLLAMN